MFRNNEQGRYSDEPNSKKSHLFYRAEEQTGNEMDVQRIAKQILNKSTSNRVVSKQECMTMLVDLDLVLCSETIENMSISSAMSVRAFEEGNTALKKGNFRKEYRDRKGEDNLSLHQFYMKYRTGKVNGKEKIPHYVGVYGQPSYPVTEAYARKVLTIHKPWRNESEHKDRSWIAEFHDFIYSGFCPNSVRIAYNRVRMRYLQKMTGYEPVAAPADCSGNPIDDDDQEMIELSGMHSVSADQLEQEDVLKTVDRGKNFDWTIDNAERNVTSNEQPENWLDSTIRREKDEGRSQMDLDIPKRLNQSGEHVEYRISDLTEDQKHAVAIILDKLLEWIETEDYSTFQPLRMIVQGAGGSGKTVFMNTAVTVIRKMFQRNDVVQVTAPTGAAAFNGGGETMHNFWMVNPGKVHDPPLQRGSKKLELLMEKQRNLLVNFVDERSMISTETLGTVEQLSREGLYSGHNIHEPWGGIPVVVLVGDDYQLPSVQPGSFSIFDNSAKRNKMQRKGEQAFYEFSNDVFELKGSKRICENETSTKALNARLRVGAPSQEDIEKLKSLDLASIENRYGIGKGK